ncbi:hypothetical protein NA56DRAFT_746506 [Hyaloscypha hepaticicola]|uniref:Uncharacterized protein n=1 Tax=Hyaloscypha hepaticicola TaxID=2082293 RepID=A0A2J6QDP9_9HELO|nr:hypothetical protein NA56DRAFT_746506 [Hyaloscypha hepaticicola]
MESFDQPFHSWIWAYDTNFVPSANSITVSDGKKYEGRMKVAMSSLFTWFYAARKEKIYSMALFREKAQRQSYQAWETQTSMGRYHHPLVLLEKGARRPFNSHELEEEA